MAIICLKIVFLNIQTHIPTKSVLARQQDLFYLNLKN